MRTLGRGLVILTLAASIVRAEGAQGTTGVESEDNEYKVVLTALPVTYSISSVLARNTSITVQNVPERPRPMNALGDYFRPRAEQLADQFRSAEAVVTIGKLWNDDPLFTAVRGANIRVVNIDATKPWSTSLEGVSVAFEPTSDVPWFEPEQGERNPSVYFWLSPANGVRAAEIIAADLVRLFPDEGLQINQNLTNYRRALLELKREYEVKFAVLLDLTVFSLSPEFVYLTSDMGLYVDGSFYKQDIDWTTEDLENFESYLNDNDIKVAIHKWEPSTPILAAIEAAQARLVVLDIIDVGIIEDGQLVQDSYIELMRSNLEALYSALNSANQAF